jgi:hypothetical protein
MPALFTPRANAVARLTLAALVVAVLAVPALAMAWVRTPWARGERRRVVQPVAFDHQFHAAMRIDCRFCHAGAERGASAGLLSTQQCAACHTRLWLSSNLFAPVRRSLAAGRPIPWRRVTQLPDFVYFDHASHLRKGVGCETCHGRVDTMQTVRQVAPLTMTWCVGCHEHPEPSLRPIERVAAMGWSAGPDADSIGRALAQRYRVRRLTNCTACHR